MIINVMTLLNVCLCCGIIGCAILGQHTRSKNLTKILEPGAHAYEGCVVSYRYYILSASYTGCQVFPENQVALLGTG